MMQRRIEIQHMTPQAVWLMERVRINEYNTKQEPYTFAIVGDNIPKLPICDDLVQMMNRARDLGQVAQASNSDEDWDRFEAHQLKMWQFAARVEDEINLAMGIT